MSGVVCGDCLGVMRGMPENVFDAVVTDSPYGLRFMGKKWDHGVPGEPFWAEALRVSKPGAMLLAFGGTRTVHRLTCAIEDAGWRIKDRVLWLHGQGFPKSKDISKAIDKEAGAEREVVGQRRQRANSPTSTVPLNASIGTIEDITAPVTAAARQWDGWGTGLKPAWEPVVVAQAPLDGTYAQNVLKWGCGGINVGGCRIATEPRSTGTKNPHAESGKYGIYGNDPRIDRQQRYDANKPQGRWPANLVLDEEAAAMLDDQSGELTTPATYKRSVATNGSWLHQGKAAGTDQFGYGDTGGASRFFLRVQGDDLRFRYVSKASRAEREAGLIGFIPCVKCGVIDSPQHISRKGKAYPLAMAGQGDIPTVAAIKAAWKEHKGSKDKLPEWSLVQCIRNPHPTVKPISLMRWLVRLVTPPNGLILDPFAGSGTTGIAAKQEGFRYVLIEINLEDCQIAQQRIAYWLC